MVTCGLGIKGFGALNGHFSGKLVRLRTWLLNISLTSILYVKLFRVVNGKCETRPDAEASCLKIRDFTAKS